MPMLERTAASLEPCNLQRVLPSTSGSIKSHRRLHSTFWSHGAADLELSGAWQAVVRDPLVDAFEPPAPAQPRPETMTASTFLLDFLYPNGAAALLRSLSPSIFDRHDRAARPLPRPGHRSYTSNALAAEQASPTTNNRDVLEARLPADRAADRAARDPGLGRHDRNISATGTTDQSTNRDELFRVLSAPRNREFDRLWSLWQKADAETRAETLVGVVEYLAQSSSLTEAGRISELLASVQPSQMEPRLVPVAVKAELQLGHASEAASIFTGSCASEQGALRPSLVPLIKYTFKTSSWGMLQEVWAHVVEAAAIPVFGASELEEMATTPQLEHKLIKLYQLAKADGVTEKQARLFSSLKATLLDPLVGVAMERIDFSQAKNLLHRAGDPILYEDFIRLSIAKGRKSAAAHAYRTYRELPNVKVRVPILQLLVQEVFYPSDPSGMEMVLKDWYRRYDRLDLWGYQKFLSFYASRGDVAAVRRLWDEHIRHYRLRLRKAGDDTFTHLLHVHAVRGEPQEAERVFRELQERYNVQLGTVCWNILLNAHAKAHDYDGAVNVFTKLCECTKPDDYTFGTMMGLSGSNGDLDFTLDLFRDARRRGVTPTVSMVDSLLEAYCQNDAYVEAETICLKATSSPAVKGNRTELWNTLLFHHGMRRDLVTVNRLLSSMTALGISYNTRTFECLLMALTYCKQSHQALKLLRVAKEEFGFRPTNTHYTILMSAFLKSKEPHMVLKTDKLLDQSGFPETSDRLLRVIQALGRYHEFPSGRGRKDAREHLVEALRRFRQTLDDPEASASAAHAHTKHVRLSQHEQIKLVTSPSARFDQLSLLIFLFSQAKDFITAREMIDIWRKSSLKDSGGLPMLKMLNAILYTSFQEKKYAEAKELWPVILEQARQAGRTRAAGGDKGHRVLPLYQYALVDAVRTMQRLHEAEGDAAGLAGLAGAVARAGFKLDSKTWNYHVQALARLKQWREAFTICEEVLMPQWTGWHSARVLQKTKNRLPLALRRVGSSPRYLRPTSYTLLTLARCYLELEQTTLWSRDASRLFAWVQGHCTQVAGAVRSLRLTGSKLEARILGDLDLDLDLTTGTGTGTGTDTDEPEAGVRADIVGAGGPGREGAAPEAGGGGQADRPARRTLDEILESGRVDAAPGRGEKSAWEEVLAQEKAPKRPDL